MNDTPPKADSIFREMLMKKSGQERLKMGFSMCDMVRKQVLASIMNDHPNLDAGEIRKAIFLRFYGSDFSSEQQEKIVAQLMNKSQTGIKEKSSL